MTMKKQIIYMVCATALLSSCHIYKAYERPDSIDATGIYRDPVSETDTLASADTTNMGNLPWKEVFRDPKLQALIEEGLANNVDMQAAVLRVEEAKVLLTSARLSFLPSINFAPQGTITSIGNSEYVKAYSTPLAASWEVDLFGKLLNASRGQKASYLQSQYSRQAVRSQLIGGIANTYYTLLMLDRQVEITAKTVDIYKENVRVMEARLKQKNAYANERLDGKASTVPHPNGYGQSCNEAAIQKHEQALYAGRNVSQTDGCGNRPTEKQGRTTGNTGIHLLIGYNQKAP